VKRFELSCRFSGVGDIEAKQTGGNGFADSHLLLEGENLHPPLRLLDEGGRVLGIWGSPIIDGKINDGRVLRALDEARDMGEFARLLDGSFLLFVYDRAQQSLTIINDRFASLAFFYQISGAGLQGSTSCKRLYDTALAAGNAQPDAEAVFQFLTMRRLFGDRTFMRGLRFLDAASILSISKTTPEGHIETYWRPDFTKLEQPVRQLADTLAEALQESMAAHESDGLRYGLMLSGGLDSRALLAASPSPPLCFTTGLSHNNEAEVAAEVAARAGAEHLFIPRPECFLNELADDSVFLAGMQIYPEAQFANYDEQVAPRADAVFLGLGLDIFFAGLYLPKSPVSLLGRKTLFHRLTPPPDDVTEAFINGVSYRLKTSDPYSVVKQTELARLRNSLRDRIGEITEQARGLGGDPTDRWEYLHLHNLSRHYSFPMAASIRSYADCRIPALTNRLFDLTFAVPAAAKTNGAVLRQAITRLNPALMEIRNANTNVTAKHSLPAQTAIHWARAAANRLAGAGFRTSPPWWERSWPQARQSIDANPNIAEMARQLPKSERLEALGIFEMTKIATTVAEHFDGQHDHAVLLNALITIDRFFAPPLKEAGR
jgi:asparagine synthase (glutamine-hydrolysing)